MPFENIPSLDAFYCNYNKTKEINERDIKSYAYSTHNAIIVCANVRGPPDFDLDFPFTIFMWERMLHESLLNIRNGSVCVLRKHT